MGFVCLSFVHTPLLCSIRGSSWDATFVGKRHLSRTVSLKAARSSAPIQQYASRPSSKDSITRCSVITPSTFDAC